MNEQGRRTRPGDTHRPAPEFDPQPVPPRGLSAWQSYGRPLMVGCAVAVVTSGTLVWLVLMCRALHALLT